MTEPMGPHLRGRLLLFRPSIGPDELPVRQEVYGGGPTSLPAGIQELWGVDAVPRIQLEIIGQLQMFMTKRDSWAVVPAAWPMGCAPQAGGWRRRSRLRGAASTRCRKKGGKAWAAQLFLGITHRLWAAAESMSAKPRQQG